MNVKESIISAGQRVFPLLLLAIALVFFGMETISYATNLGSSLTQCANDSNNDGIIESCKWVTGALTTANSDYAESDGVPQRWFFEHLSTGSTEDHTAVFEYTFTKNSVYAYDFLVNVDHTMPMSLINPCSNLAPFVAPDDCVNAFGTAVNVPIPSDPFDAVALREHPPIRNILFGCVQEGQPIVPPPSFVCANVSIDPPVHVPNTNCFQNCGDSKAQITVHFRTPVSGQHLIAMYVSGQLASAKDPDGAGPAIGWGTGFGASSAPGASFHFKLVTLDGKSVGGEDDQISSNLIEQSHNADLAVDKTCPATVVKGNNVSYTITVTNNGPDTATNVFIDDTLPSGVTFVSATPSQGTCNAPVGTTLHCDIGFMQPTPLLSSTAIITVVVTVPSGFVGSSITDSVTVGGAVIDPVSGNNTDSCTTSLQAPTPPVDLSVTKTDAPDPVIAGNNLTYTVTVTNNSGAVTATGVTLTDSLPGGVILPPVSVTPSQGSCGVSSNVITCNLGSLAPLGSATVTIVVTVNPSARGTITNVATVTGDQTDNNLSNNTASEPTQVNGQIDLSVTKTCPGTATEGSLITYHIQVNNAGPSTSLDTHIEDILPSGVTFISATPSQGTGCTFNLVDTVHCVLGNIAAGGSATVDIVVLINSGTAGNTLTNDAHIHVHNGEDTNSGNDMSTCGTTVQPLPPTTVDLSVTKTDSPDPVFAGNNLTYTITVMNNSPTTSATNVTLTDTLPAGVTFVSYFSASFTCSESSGVVTCGPLASLAALASASVQITVTVDPSVRGTISNTVVVVGSQPDPNTSNNTATEPTQVNGQVGLSITKTDSPDPVLNGNNLTYTILVSNSGPSNATSVQVVDTLPAGVGGTFFTASATQGSGCIRVAQTVTCNLGTMSPGGSATITIVVSVNVLPGSVITNNATATSAEDPTGVSAQQSTTVIASVIIPTLSEWGIIIFMVFAGLGSIYHLRRRKRI